MRGVGVGGDADGRGLRSGGEGDALVVAAWCRERAETRFRAVGLMARGSCFNREVTVCSIPERGANCRRVGTKGKAVLLGRPTPEEGPPSATQSRGPAPPGGADLVSGVP